MKLLRILHPIFTHSLSNIRPRMIQPIIFGYLAFLLFEAIVLMAILWPRAIFALDIGMPGDRLFVSHVYGDERVAEYSYRWTGNGGDTQLSIPGWTSVQRIHATLRIRSSPQQGPVDLEFLVNGNVVALLHVSTDMASQTVDFTLAPNETNGTALRIALRSPLHEEPPDTRQLGIMIDSIRLEPLSWDLSTYLRTVWPVVAMAELLCIFLLGIVRAQSWPIRVGVASVIPLAAAAALPWTIALLPAMCMLVIAGLVVQRRQRLQQLVLAIWAILDRSQVGHWSAAFGILIYLIVLGRHIVTVPWIGYADYASNAVVARNLVLDRGFSVDYAAQFYRLWPAPRHPVDTSPPLQPLMIAASFTVFGISTAAAKIPNVLISACLLGSVYYIGTSVWRPRVGLLAGTLLAINARFFEGATYPLNDIAFTALSFGSLMLLWKLTTTPVTRNEQSEKWRWRTRAWWALLGLISGLLILAKPGGALLLLGGTGWACLHALQHKRLKVVLAAGLIAVIVAVAVYFPWGVRNTIAFGSPFYTTEQYDAWVTDDRNAEDIYRAYIFQGDLPHPRQLTSYSFDSMMDKVVQQSLKGWGDLQNGALIPSPLLPLAALGGCVITDMRRRGLLKLLTCAIVPYALFIVTYWHYEPGYTLVLLPWVMLLAASGFWWISDSLFLHRLPQGRFIVIIVTIITLLALIKPQIDARRDGMESERRTPSSVVVADWLRHNTPPEAIIMTRSPWELAFHSERQTVMIPFDNIEHIEAIADHYGVDYIQLDRSLKNTIRPALTPLYEGKELPGFQKVYDDGSGGLVYKYTAQNR